MLPDEAFFNAVALPHSQNFLKGEPREHPESSMLSHTANSVLLFPITNLIKKPIKKEKTIVTQRFFSIASALRVICLEAFSVFCWNAMDVN